MIENNSTRTRRIISIGNYYNESFNYTFSITIFQKIFNLIQSIIFFFHRLKIIITIIITSITVIILILQSKSIPNNNHVVIHHNLAKKNTNVPIVAKNIPHHQILHVIVKHIVLLVTKKHDVVHIVTKYTLVYQLLVCTFELTIKVVNVTFVANVFHVHGYFKDIFVRILVRLSLRLSYTTK